MSSSSRHTPSPGPSSPPNHSTSKLPKFLQKQTYRERSASKNAIDSTGDIPSTTSISAASSSSSPETIPALKPRKTSKFLSINKEDKNRKYSDTFSSSSSTTPTITTTLPDDEPVDEAPVIVEPVSIPRPRTRSERPASSAPEIHHINQPQPPPVLYSSASSTSRIGDLPTRLSGWFQHTFSTSSTDLSLSTLLAQQVASPNKGKGPNALLTAARHGKGHLDKAMRYLLDSDATPDKSSEPIWLLGVQHPGYEPPPPSFVPPPSPGGTEKRRRGSASPPVSFRSSTSSIAPEPLSQSTSSLPAKHHSANNKHDPSANWPPVFYLDFTSRIWLTYRSQFSIPIRDGRLADLCGDNWQAVACPTGTGTTTTTTTTTTPSLSKKAWPWSVEKTWSSDSGWGCMLRTGQSLLANALVHVHLGREWRRPPYPVQTADYATYVQILTWFLDTPAPETPFSVHRMALAGKELGTDVGQWFGPSVAAGAIRTLISQFPECGLAVSVATDSILYQTQVFAASHGETDYRSPKRHYTRSWGDKPVLLLLGIRLGIECVNPIYYDTIKRLYEFPQSVGIAGGRPSSSYYFVGSQSDNLFYLDPHNTRPAIPLRLPPSNIAAAAHERRATVVSSSSQSDSDLEPAGGGGGSSSAANHRSKTRSPSSSHHQHVSPIRKHHQHHRVPTSGTSSSTSTRYASSSVSSHHQDRSTVNASTYSPPPPAHAPLSPSPLQQQLSSSSADSSSTSYSTASTGMTGESAVSLNSEHLRSPPPPSYEAAKKSGGSVGYHGRWRSQTVSGRTSTYSDSNSMDPRDLLLRTEDDDNNENELDPMQIHLCNAYSAMELKTFHCERVRKMPLSGLDPSMLIGFLCRDESDWWDFRRRVGELPKTIFSVQDEPPTWPADSDDNMGLESMSEPDDLDLEDDEDGLLESTHSRHRGSGDDEEIKNDDEDEENDEPFFDTQSGSATSSLSQGRTSSQIEEGRRSWSKSEEVDTEDDPVGPITPGPGSRFEFVRSKAASEEDNNNDDEEEDGEGAASEASSVKPLEVEDVGVGMGGDDDIEDDWTDPSVPSPTPIRSVHSASKDPSPSPPSSSNVPPLAKGRLKTSKSTSRSSSKSKSKSKKGKQTPVPVPSVMIPIQPQQEHYYPFPVTPADEPTTPPVWNYDYEGERRSRQSSATRIVPKQPRMHMARARDGGRTQSGGVKGILPSESV